MKKNRPKHLALHQIKFPLPALVSGIHRIGGLVLFLVTPLLLLMFQYSLRSVETVTQLSELLQNSLVKLILTFILWLFLHHFCAGIRALTIDFDLGVSLAQARASSKLVFIVSIVLTVLIGVRLW